MRATIKRPDLEIVFEGEDAAEIGIAVAAYQSQLESPRVVVNPGPEPLLPPWEEFISRVEDKPDQLAVLRLLKLEGPYALTQLADKLGAEGTLELGGLLGAIRRTTLRSGFPSTDDVILKKGRFYHPGPALMANELPADPAPRVTRHDLVVQGLEEDT